MLQVQTFLLIDSATSLLHTLAYFVLLFCFCHADKYALVTVSDIVCNRWRGF